jgi:hypothetical protein
LADFRGNVAILLCEPLSKLESLDLSECFSMNTREIVALIRGKNNQILPNQFFDLKIPFVTPKILECLDQAVNLKRVGYRRRKLFPNNPIRNLYKIHEKISNSISPKHAE